MKTSRTLLLVLSVLLCAYSLPAGAATGYRLIPLDDGTANLQVFDLNVRGEVVGMRADGDETHAFLWRAGTLTDLHAVIDPSATYTQASGINDFSTIVGDIWTGEEFKGFRLRGGQVTPVLPDGYQVFPFDINNRGQIIVDSGSSSYFIDGDQVEALGGLPGETDVLHSVALNNRGAVAGYTQTSAGTRAVLWQGGTIENLGVVAGGSTSFADDINDWNEVVGFVVASGVSHAMRWRDGTMELLPRLSGEVASGAQSINNWGMAVGSTTLSPDFRQTATLWWGNQAVELDSLVRADDPLKPFVHLTFAGQINDRGDIVATGIDSRTNLRIVYFMRISAMAGSNAE
jgi:probable HAF family extracellular repeat protein